MTSAIYDFSIEQGTDLIIPIVLKDSEKQTLNLEGYSVQMQLRPSLQSQTALDTLSTENERIELSPTEGKITLNFPHEVTAEYPSGTYLYDIELVSSIGIISRFLKGTITVIPEITRV